MKHHLGKNKQTNKQTNKTETKPIKHLTNEFHVALWPCGHVSVKDLRSRQAVESGTRRAAECVTDALTTFKVF